MWAKHKQPGFTIVELLVVIVVIGILAAITIVAYNGFQVRARDTQRASDAASILKALDAYKAIHGTYPAATSTSGGGSWEMSSETPGTFMEYLQSTFSTSVPVDPINDANHYYRYYRYNVASLTAYGCATDKGNLLVFYTVGFENAANKPANDPSLICTSNSWGGSTTSYFKYKYENG